MHLEKLAYTIKELSEVTGLSRSRLYEEIASGRLRVGKSGSRTIATATAVQDFLSLTESEAGGGW